MEDKSQVAGVLSIISGALGILGIVLVVVFFRFMVKLVELDPVAFDVDPTFPYEFSKLLIFMYTTIGVLGTIVGILGIVGGVFAIKRKYWGLALAGAIASIFTFFPCGVAAVVFVSMAKPDFNASTLIPKTPSSLV